MYLDDVIPESLNLESNPAPDQTRDDILDSPVLPAFASKKIIPTAYDILFHLPLFGTGHSSELWFTD
jgi:hypothetical protein